MENQYFELAFIRHFLEKMCSTELVIVFKGDHHVFTYNHRYAEIQLKSNKISETYHKDIETFFNKIFRTLTYLGRFLLPLGRKQLFQAYHCIFQAYVVMHRCRHL